MERDIDSLVTSYLGNRCCCAEAIVRVGLDLLGTPNDQMANAASSLCGGMHAGYNCGALSGGVLMLSLFCDKTAAAAIVPELVSWFDDTYGMQYGSIDCVDIAGERKEHLKERCKPIVIATCEKCVEILVEHGLIAQEGDR